MIHDSEKKLGILISMFGVLCLTLSLTLAASISNENTVESNDYYSDLRQQFIMQNASAIVNYSWVGSGTQINDFSVFKSIAKHVDAKTMFFMEISLSGFSLQTMKLCCTRLRRDCHESVV